MNNKGKIGETIAKNYLIAKGYEILGTNIRWKRFEIDILALFKGVIIAVEVKYRAREEFFDISPNQINNIGTYLDEFYYDQPRSIEGIFVNGRSIEHFEI